MGRVKEEDLCNNCVAISKQNVGQLTRSWYLSHRQPAKAECTGSPEPLLFVHIKYVSRRRVRPKIRHLAPLDGCACVFEE